MGMHPPGFKVDDFPIRIGWGMLGDQTTSICHPMSKYARRLLLFATLLWCPQALASLLPETPGEGLLVTVTLACDFTDRWWELTFFPGRETALELRSQGLRRLGPDEAVSELRIPFIQRTRLYTAARRTFADFRIETHPTLDPELARERWLGEKTLTLAAMVLDEDLGRVDRAELAFDVMQGRHLRDSTAALMTAVGEIIGARATQLDCR